MTVNTLAIVGTGIMGMGIAQIAAQAGIQVLLYDAKAGAAEQGRHSLQAMLEKLTAKGKFSDDELQAMLSRLTVVQELSQIATAEIVVEAIIENLDIKKQLFAQLESVITADTILATNTSSLSVTAIAADCEYPERVAGFHFFNPVPLMKIVEIIPGLSTQQSVIDALTDLAKRMGHLGVVAKDTPGFIVNHGGRAYGTEALKILGEGVAIFEQIDRILRDGAGFRMGPFELLDLTGIDVSHPVMESIYDQFYHEARYRPHPLTRQMLVGKKLGRKVGEGFYQYEKGQKVSVDSAQNQVTKAALVDDATIRSVWIGADLAEDKTQLIDYLNAHDVTIDDNDTPHPDSLVLLAIYGEDTTNAAIRYQVDPKQAVAIDMLTELTKHRTLMPSIVTQERFVAQAYALFGSSTGNKGSDSREADAQEVSSATLIAESTGFVAQRVVAMVINLGCDIAMQKIATPEDIDNAVKLGLGYPYGPISWGDHLGASRVLLILERIYELTGDPRYRPSPWLQRRAKLDMSLFTQQNTY
ncbi:3-hydroxyacyl-CoA dehydrogenase [Psychrobacter nivimaris]|uniref:3-hydroxyacyl-CoA dehydrogenase n=1 Tax=Psychrobacter nivimaris TaxID=281738 RepID=A0A6N7BXW0_9GAMM|nr:3-hydroxyacyl-CoA dehydrogenase [Psychrobacter nivimaris]KAF0567866.1 3-hydroxyacyl-CoA dehydrogenase [Psychrobacter nivimaris]|tara:strand:+ start:1444 stop:3027 length:1584 start_codon:yes stop_codon:yes gene_type:complete